MVVVKHLHGFVHEAVLTSEEQQDISEHNCYCITAIASKQLHQIKHNRDSPYL